MWFIRLTYLLTFSLCLFLLHFDSNTITSYIVAIKIILQLVISFFDIVYLSVRLWKMINQLTYFSQCLLVHWHFILKQTNVYSLFLVSIVVDYVILLIIFVVKLLRHKCIISEFTTIFLIFKNWFIKITFSHGN